MRLPSDLFLALWIGWALYWLAAARGNKRSALPTNPRWRVFGTAIALAVYLLMRRFPHLLNRRLLPPSLAREWICLALAAAGVAFAIRARRVLGTNWSATPTIKQGHELIQTGPYSLVRHPIYSGLLLAIFASCLAGARLWNLVMFLLILGGIWWKMKIEEALMLRQFPREYPAYRERTKAIIPHFL